MITFEQRVSRILSVNDLDEQLRLAKNYTQAMKRKAKQADSLEEKIKLKSEEKEAFSVLRKLRTNYFDIEDSINARLNSASM